MSDRALVPTDLVPGMVRPGLAEEILEQVLTFKDEADIPILWDGATTGDALSRKWQGHVDEQGEFRRAQLYCEVQLGEVLGPNPGRGGDRKSERARSNNVRSLIPSMVESRIRRFHGHRDDLIARIRSRELQNREECLFR